MILPTAFPSPTGTRHRAHTVLIDQYTALSSSLLLSGFPPSVEVNLPLGNLSPVSFHAAVCCQARGSYIVPGASLCAFCRVVVPTKCCLNLNQPPCYKMFLGFLMVDQKPMWVTTKWLRKRGAVKNHDSLLNGFWKFHSKSLVYFPGPRS